MKVQRYSSTKTWTLASMKNVFCNIVDGNRVRSGMTYVMCACVHLHRSMLAHICFVGSALLPWLPGSSKVIVSCWPKIHVDFRDRKFL